MCHKGDFFYPAQIAEVFMVVIENIKIEIIFKNYLETQREVLCSLLFFFWFCIGIFF